MSYDYSSRQEKLNFWEKTGLWNWSKDKDQIVAYRLEKNIPKPYILRNVLHSNILQRKSTVLSNTKAKRVTLDLY